MPQQGHGTPPPFSVQMSTPSPVKRDVQPPAMGAGAQAGEGCHLCSLQGHTILFALLPVFIQNTSWLRQRSMRYDE
jgi:hypothetical protein